MSNLLASEERFEILTEPARPCANAKIPKEGKGLGGLNLGLRRGLSGIHNYFQF